MNGQKMGDRDGTIVVEQVTKSQSEILTQRRKNAEREKARGYWRLLRESIRSTVHAVTEADIRTVQLNHGIHHKKRLNNTEELQDVLLVSDGQEYVTLDESQIQVFSNNGKRKCEVQLEEPVDRLLYSAQNKLYVGYTKGHKVLYLMTSEFEIQSSAKALAPIVLALYNTSTNEVITVGPGLFTAWRFRYNCRYLLPRKITKLEGFEEVTFGGMTLEETASRSQRCFLSLDTGVVEYNVHEGQFIYHHKDLHTRTITALMFFNPLKQLVTGARDGCIKVWDKTMQVKMVFVGHTDSVNYLGVYPYGPAVLSASFDSTVRVWSLESCDEVDRTELNEPVKGLCSQLDHDIFITYSGKTADLWQIRHLYHMHTSVGYRVLSMKHTSHPLYPVRSVLLCKDSSVRLVSPLTGDVITTLLQHPKKGLVDAAYAIGEDTMFVATGSGSIVKCRTDTNPCTVVAEWTYDNPSETCNYLLVYEYLVSPMMKDDVWRAMSRTVTTRALHESTKGRQKNMNHYLLLGGRKDGYLCVLNWNTGHVDFEIEAHGVKGVLSMIANSKEDQLISAGMDNIIKVWRLYPFAEETLSPLMSFYCGHTPLHMVIIKNALCVAFHDHSTATYSVVLYNLITKNRSDHKPDDDHQDTITGLTACRKLRVFATSSQDGTVRIWSETNQLLRILRLGIVPHSIGFCSQKGDLLLGIGEHVSKVPHHVYMPKTYLLKMACMKFLTIQPDCPIPFDENLVNQLSKSDVKRLKNAKASLKYEEYGDKLSSEEEDEVTREARAKEQGYSVIEERENELRLLRDGAITCKKKPRKTAKTQREALRQFMKLYYNKPRIELPPDRVFEEGPKPKDDEESRWSPEREPTGFFPPHSEQKTQADDGSTIPVVRGGFVPNSVLLRLLWPNPPPVSKPDYHYRPPTLSSKQLDEIAGGETVEDGSFASEEELHGPVKPRKKLELSDDVDRVIHLDLSDDEEEELPPTNLLSKFEDILQKPPTPKEEEEETTAVPPEPENAEPPKTPKTPRKSPPTNMVVKKPLIPRREPRPKMVVRVVSTPEVKPASPVSTLPEPSPTPPPPAAPTPLPEFITQFKGQEWFEKYFPGCGPETFPKPWTVEAFAALLGRVLKIASYKHKVDISAALMVLNSMVGLENSNAVCRCYLTVLTQPPPPTALVVEEKTFIITSLNAFQSLGGNELDVIVEVLSQYIDGDKEIRETALAVLFRMGVQDPHGYLPQELDSWDTWNIEERNRKTVISSMCRNWLNRWMASFKIHLEDTIEKLKKGQNVHGKLGRKQQSSLRTNSLRRHSQASQGEESILGERSETLTTLPEGSDIRPSSHDKRLSHRSVTMSVDSIADPSVLDNATYIEAMNYFCEITFEKEMDKMRKRPVPPITEDHGSQTRNTVLVLPNIRHKPVLVRLGETHTSFCRPKRETFYNTEYSRPTVAPGEFANFPTSINLPMKKLYLNPFPSPLDDFDLRFQEPVLITLKSSQKYFIPDQSYCPLPSINAIPAAR